MNAIVRARAMLAALLIATSTLAALPAPALAQSAKLVESSAAEKGKPETPAPLPAQKETVDNPYGLDALWKGGDVVAKGTLTILVIMSLGSWYIIFTKLYEQFKLGRYAKSANESFWTAGGVAQAIETLKEGSPFHYLATSAQEATTNHHGLRGHIDLNTWITQSIQRSIENIQNRLQDGLAFLATVGSTAPFVGLFGTVWGIYHALTAIGIAGQASIDKVAGPVGEALIMTAIGLGVAVPAVLGYNWLVRRNKAALEKVRAFGVDLHGVILGDVANAAAIAATSAKASPVRIVNVAFAS
jgi:biopolymer transport protein ExbB